MAPVPRVPHWPAPVLFTWKGIGLTVRERYMRAVPWILAAYIVVVAAGFLYFNMRLTVEWVAIVLFVAALLSGRALLFLKDWGVFIVVLLAWQLASPLATRFGFPWHLTELIDADRALAFGTVPPLWLQQHLYHPGVLEPWDVLAATMYMLHFLAPLVAGFMLWMANRELFQKFAITFVVVAVCGFATYILYPAVPPWMAAERLVHVHGMYFSTNWQDLQSLKRLGYAHPYAFVMTHGQVYLPGVKNIFQSIMSRWYNPYNGTIFFSGLHLSYDKVGAIPSEHAAYPLLFFLFLRRQFGRAAYGALLYIALLLFSITYLGQHYLIDAVVGFAYAIVGYVAVMHAAPAIMHRIRAPRRSAPQLVPVELEEA